MSPGQIASLRIIIVIIIITKIVSSVIDILEHTLFFLQSCDACITYCLF